MIFLVVEESVTVRHIICQMLASLGIKAEPADSRERAEKAFAFLRAPSARPGIEGAVIDIDDQAGEGRALIAALKAQPSTRDMKIIALTSQSQRTAIVPLAELGVAGFLHKPIKEAETFKKLRTILSKSVPSGENHRRHVRIAPPAGDLARLDFRVSGLPGLVSGKIRNLSMGGVGLELITPLAEGVLKPDTYLEIRFTISGRELQPSGVVIIVRGNSIGIRFTTLETEDSLSLARYIYERAAS